MFYCVSLCSACFYKKNCYVRTKMFSLVRSFSALSVLQLLVINLSKAEKKNAEKYKKRKKANYVGTRFCREPIHTEKTSVVVAGPCDTFLRVVRFDCFLLWRVLSKLPLYGFLFPLLVFDVVRQRNRIARWRRLHRDAKKHEQLFTVISFFPPSLYCIARAISFPFLLLAFSSFLFLSSCVSVDSIYI